MRQTSGWRRLLSGLTACSLVLGQAVPPALADAVSTMRATATDGSPAGERQLGLDAGFAYGPGGPGMAEFGPANLPVLGRTVIVEPAVRERRAFAIANAQPLEPQTADYLRSFAGRYGFPLPADRAVALRADLRRLQEAVLAAAGGAPDVPFVFIMKEWATMGADGRPVLALDRVGGPYHYALIGSGIEWAGGRAVPVDFETAVGLLQLGDAGRQALIRLLAHDLASVQAGRYQDWTDADRDAVNGQLAQAAARLRPSDWLDDLLRRRQALAGDAAEALRRPETYSTTMDLSPLIGRAAVREHLPAIRTALDALVRDGRLASAAVESLNGARIVLTTAYAPRIGPDGARLRDPGIDSLVAQTVIRAVSPAASSAPPAAASGAMPGVAAVPVTGLDLRPYPAVAAFVAAQTAALAPARVEVLDTSDQARLEREAIEAGEVYEGRDGNLYAFSHPDDTARAEKPTYVASRNAADAGMFNNHRLTDAIEPAVDQRLAGVAAGQTVYVVPYMVGPADSPHRGFGVQLTDKRYVALNIMRLYNERRVTLGRQALEAIGQGTRFVQATHGTGDLDAVKRTEGPDDDRHFVNFVDERRVKSFGSAYGGNAIIPKKFHSLRQSIYDAVQDGRQGRYWLAEHMLILGVQDLQTGQTTYIAGAFPSASGKTNLAMLEPPPALRDRYRVWLVSDDLAHLHIGSDGRLRAINPEHGLFGVVPGTSARSNPNALAAIGPGTGTLFTNIAVKFERNPSTGRLEVVDRWWEGLTDQPPWDQVDAEPAAGDEGWHDWTRQRLRLRSADARGKPWAQSNSRFTTSIDNAPSWIGHAAGLPEGQRPTDWDHPEGVPVTVILFGARRSDTEPAIRQLPDAVSGIADGFFMIGETTAATTGAVGVLKEDPYAQRSFFSVPEADYVAHELTVHGALGDRAPAFFHVNWFRKDGEGRLLWPGYGENLRLLLWAIDRAKGQGEAMPTPVGYIPTLDSLNLEGLNVPPERLAGALSFNVEQWTRELERRSAWLAKFGDRMPLPIRQSHERQVRALAALLGARWDPPAVSGGMADPVEPPGREQVYDRIDQTYGLTLVDHAMTPEFTSRFLAGRLPGDGAALLERVRHPMLATQVIAMETLQDQGIVPRHQITDKAVVTAVKETADLRAQMTQDTMARLNGRQILHMNFETKGEIAGGHIAGMRTGDPDGEVTFTASDVIEGTTAFVQGRPGAASIQIEGPGAEQLGMFTDEARALMVVTRINPSLETTVLAASGAESIEQYLDPNQPVEVLLRRIARLNGLPSENGLSQLHVTVLSAEPDDLAELERLKQNGLLVDVITEGTVQPAIAASLGVEGGLVRVFLRRSGMTEAVLNTLMASAFTADGSISLFRVVSQAIKQGHAHMYEWSDNDLLMLQAYRQTSGDFEQIRDGQKIFSSRQVTRPVAGAYTLLTPGRSDRILPWGLPGVTEADGVYDMRTMVFASDEAGPGRGALATYHSQWRRAPPSAGVSGAMAEPGGIRRVRVLYVDEDPLRQAANEGVIRQQLSFGLDVDSVDVLAVHGQQEAERALQAAQQDGEHLDLVVAHESAPYLLGLIGTLRGARPGDPAPAHDVPVIVLASLRGGSQPWHRNALALGHVRLLDVEAGVASEPFRRIAGELTQIRPRSAGASAAGAMAEERRIILPQDARPAAPSVMPGRQLRVLVVDDGAGAYDRRRWTAALNSLRDGYGLGSIQVIERSSAEAQVMFLGQAAVGQPFDVVVFGYELSGLNGLDLARQLSRHDPDHHAVMIMFARQADEVLRAMSRGVGIADVRLRLFGDDGLAEAVARELQLTRREAPAAEVLSILRREFPELVRAELWSPAAAEDRVLAEGIRDHVRLLAAEPSMAGLLPGITRLADDLDAWLSGGTTSLAGLIWADFTRGPKMRPLTAAEATIDGQNYILFDRMLLEAIARTVRVAESRGEREAALAGAAQELVIAYLHERAESVSLTVPMGELSGQLSALGIARDRQYRDQHAGLLSVFLGEAVGLAIELQALRVLDEVYAAGGRTQELTYAQAIDDEVKAMRTAAGVPRTATSAYAWRYSRALYEVFPDAAAAQAFQAAWRGRDAASPAARFFGRVLRQAYQFDGGEQAFGAAAVILEHLFGSGAARAMPRGDEGTVAGSMAGAPARHLRILFVDDDEIVRYAFSRRAPTDLKTAGLSGTIDYAQDGREALAKLEQAPYDVVVLDWQMPRLDGIGLLRAMRAHADTRIASTPAVLQTAQSLDDELLAQGRSAGAGWVIGKGADYDELVGILSDLAPDPATEDRTVSGGMADPRSESPGREEQTVTAAGTARGALQQLPFSAEVRRWAAEPHPEAVNGYEVWRFRGDSGINLAPGWLHEPVQPGDRLIVRPDLSMRARGIEGKFHDWPSAMAAGEFHHQLAAGSGGSLAMLPTYLQRPTGRETGRFIGLDVGGTNIRALLVEFDGRGGYRVIESASAPWQPDEISAGSTPERFFGAISAVVRTLLDRPSIRGARTPGQSIPVGFTFSFPVQQTGVASGTVVNFSKEFEVPGVVGSDPVAMLRQALRRDGLAGVEVVALLNDTTGTLLAGAYQRPDTDMGLILGTGTNMAEDDPIRGQLINTEAGGFDSVMQNRYDRALDAASASPGAHKFEKQVSGLYLGEVARLALVDLLRGTGPLAQALERPNSLKPEAASEIEAQGAAPAAAARRLETALGLPGGSVSEEQAVAVIRVLTAVSNRAARLVAAQVAATALHIDGSRRARRAPSASGTRGRRELFQLPGSGDMRLDRDHRVAVDGSVFEHYWRMPERIGLALADMLGQDADRIRFDLTKDGSGIGAAVAAAVVSHAGPSVVSGAMAVPQDEVPPAPFAGADEVMAGLLDAAAGITAAGDDAARQVTLALAFIDRVPKIASLPDGALRRISLAGDRDAYWQALETVRNAFQDGASKDQLYEVSPGSRMLRRYVLIELGAELPSSPPPSAVPPRPAVVSGAMSQPPQSPGTPQPELIAALPFDRQVELLQIRTDGPPGGDHLTRGPLAHALGEHAPGLTRTQAEQAADVSTHRWTVFHSSVFLAMDASAELARHQAELAGALRGDGRWGGQRGTHVAWVMQGTATPEEAEIAFAAQLAAINARLAGLAILRRDDVLLLPETDTDQALRLLESALPGSRVTAAFGPDDFAASFYRDSGKSLVPIALPDGAGADAGTVGTGAGVAAGVAASARGGSPDPDIPLPRREDEIYVPPIARVTDPGVEQELRGFRQAVGATDHGV